MKKIIAALLAGCMIWQGCFAAVTDFDKPGQKINNPNVELPAVELPKIEEGTAIVEAEDLELSDEGQIISDANASGKKAVKFINTTFYTDPKDSKNPTITVSLDTAGIEGSYQIWVRKVSDTDGNDSVYMSTTDENGYAYTGLGVAPGYTWANVGALSVGEDVTTFYIKARETGGTIIDKFIITNDMNFAPTGKDDVPDGSAASTTGLWADPPIAPEIGKHPRLFVTDTTVAEIKEKAQSELFQNSYKLVKQRASETIDMSAPNTGTSNSFGAPKLTKIRARALMYLIGEVDDAHGKQTIAYMREFLETVQYDVKAQDITRSMGEALIAGGLVYDWCYNLMTEEDKEVFIKHFKRIASQKEIGYPPTKGSSVGSHSGEGEIMRDMMCAGIACYDEYPTMYNMAAGRFFAEYVESRKMYNKSGAHPNGCSYGGTRLGMEVWPVAIFSRMGMDDVLGEEIGDVPMTWIYDRLPTGQFFKDGDEWLWGQNKYFNYSTSAHIWSYLILGNDYDNPYVRGEWMKDLSLQNYAQEADWTLLLGSLDKEWKYTDDLPLSYATTWPLTSITARTSWQTGLNAPTAMVKMSAHEINIEDHMHKDIGSFQIYYKGSLAVDTGNYSSGYGSAHDYAYNKRTVAHNAMLVYDPSESFGVLTGNDGGQKGRSVVVVQTYEDLMNEENFRAETQGVYIGPNEKTPEFSYLKTDLSNAYSAKVDNYQRSMVFMDLFDDEYPAAFVVFDHIKSSNKDFKKSWLLHSEQEPTVNGNTTTIVRDENGFNGKLVNKTMLPQNHEITKIGGEGHEFEVYGKNYPYSTPEARIGSESGNWRIEVSPTKANQEDTFLNAMYVTDADGNLAELPMIQESNGRFVGVTVKDRYVLFDKNGVTKDTVGSISIRDNGYATVSALIGDVATGFYNVKGANGTEIVVEVKEGENALYFKGAPGMYTVTKAAEGATATAFTYPEAQKQKFGDFLIYHKGDSMYHYLEQPTKLVDGVPYIPAEVTKEIGASSVTYNGNSVTITGYGGTAVFTADQYNYSLNGKSMPISKPVIKDGNVIYIPFEGLVDSLYVTSTYDSLAHVLYVASQTLRAEFQNKYNAKALIPVEITAIENDGNIEANTSDWSLATRWSAEGTDRWLQFDMGETVNFSKVMIAFYSGNVRQTTFSLQTSDDGVNWKTVYADGKSSGSTTDFESFLTPGASGRYIRFVGQGNNLNMWNSIAEMVIIQ